jgi:hypothetical protein
MLVNGIKDGPTNQSINYSGIIPILVAEIQELKRELQDVKRQLQTQTTNINKSLS